MKISRKIFSNSKTDELSKGALKKYQNTLIFLAIHAISFNHI